MHRISARIKLAAEVGIPVLVSGEMSSTQTEPGKSLYPWPQTESRLPEWPPEARVFRSGSGR